MSTTPNFRVITLIFRLKIDQIKDLCPGNLVAGLLWRLTQSIGEFLDQKIQRPVKVFPVRRAQSSFYLQLAQTPVDIGVANRVPTLHDYLAGIGAVFPMAAHSGLPLP